MRCLISLIALTLFLAGCGDGIAFVQPIGGEMTTTKTTIGSKTNEATQTSTSTISTNAAIDEVKITPPTTFTRTYPLAATATGAGLLTIVTTVTTRSIDATLTDAPPLADDARYTAWMIRIEPFDARRLGTLTMDDATQTFAMQATMDTIATGYTRFVVTRDEPHEAAFDATQKIVEVILDGDVVKG